MDLVDGHSGQKPHRGSGCRSVAIVLMLIVLGIPTVIAYKAYRDLVFLRGCSEGRQLARRPMAAVADYYARNHAFPLDNAQTGLREPTTFHGRSVREVAVSNGSVTVLFSHRADERLADRKMVFSPHADGSSLNWTCDSGVATAADGSRLPSICRR